MVSRIAALKGHAAVLGVSCALLSGSCGRTGEPPAKLNLVLGVPPATIELEENGAGEEEIIIAFDSLLQLEAWTAEGYGARQLLREKHNTIVGRATPGKPVVIKLVDDHPWSTGVSFWRLEGSGSVGKAADCAGDQFRQCARLTVGPLSCGDRIMVYRAFEARTTRFVTIGRDPLVILVPKDAKCKNH